MNKTLLFPPSLDRSIGTVEVRDENAVVLIPKEGKRDLTPTGGIDVIKSELGIGKAPQPLSLSIDWPAGFIGMDMIRPSYFIF